MIEKDSHTNPLSVRLTGSMGQPTILLFLAIGGSLGLAFASSAMPNDFLKIGAAFMGLLGTVATITVIIGRMFAKPDWPTDPQPPTSLLIKAKSGRVVDIKHPPNDLMKAAEIQNLVRLLMSEIDRDLKPAGEVIGDVAEGRTRQYTEEEQAKWVQQNQVDIENTFVEATRIAVEMASIVKSETFDTAQEVPQDRDGKKRGSKTRPETKKAATSRHKKSH